LLKQDARDDEKLSANSGNPTSSRVDQECRGGVSAWGKQLW